MITGEAMALNMYDVTTQWASSIVHSHWYIPKLWNKQNTEESFSVYGRRCIIIKVTS